jgi:hypothetical protein
MHVYRRHAYGMASVRSTPMRDAVYEMAAYERHAYEMAPMRSIPMRDAPVRDAL